MRTDKQQGMDAKQLSRLFSKAKEFAKERGYNYIRYKCPYKSYIAYFVHEEEPDSIDYFGYPSYILVSANGNARMANFDEVYDILAL